MHTSVLALGLVTALAVATTSPAQFGKRISPIIDVTAIVRTNPLFASATNVDFACRAADGCWWVKVNGYMLRLDPSLASIGAIPAPAGIPVYEPLTDRIYFAFGVTGQWWLCLVSCYPTWSYWQTSFGFDYLQLDGSTTIVRQLASYPFNPYVPPSSPHVGIPPLPPAQWPLQVACNRQGAILVSTDAGLFSFDAVTGMAAPTGLPPIITPFMLLPGNARYLSPKPGSCLAGPASSCLRTFDLQTGVEMGISVPVDLGVAGPGALRGGNVVAIYPLFDLGEWRAFVLTHGTNATYFYNLDVTSPSEWPGCGGGFQEGPVIEQTQLAAYVTLPASAAWLIVSPSYLSATIPGLLPANCATYLDPASHIALSPILLPTSGHGGWRVPVPVVPGLDNSALYFQCLYASLSGFGATSDARSAVIRQF